MTRTSITGRRTCANCHGLRQSELGYHELAVCCLLTMLSYMNWLIPIQSQDLKFFCSV
jgi:hypothetical protein